MQRWDLLEIETPEGSRSPVVLHSDPNLRLVLIGLSPGQELGDHQVKENAIVTVVDGTVRVAHAGGEAIEARSGTVFRFDPDERRSVSTELGARLLLVFVPWPGAGHYRGEERAAG